MLSHNESFIISFSPSDALPLKEKIENSPKILSIKILIDFYWITLSLIISSDK